MNKKGYILFVTFSMLALCSAMVSTFLVKGVTHKRLAHFLLQRQEVDQLAVSATALGQSFLSFSKDEIEGVQQEGLAQKVDNVKPRDGDTGFGRLLLERVLPVINAKQKFELNEKNDGMKATIEFSIFCECGKININSLYNIGDQKFYDQGIDGLDKKVFAQWIFDKIASITGKPSLLKPFEEHVKHRKAPFNDVTELLSIKEFASCFSGNVFYEFDEEDKEKKLKKDGVKLFLTDLFTVSSESDKLQPWLLSPSVCVLLGIVEKDKEKDLSEAKKDKSIFSFFKQKVDWQKDWDSSLQKVYGISYQSIPQQVRSLLMAEFRVNVFSVLIAVTRGDIKSRVFAILKQRMLPDHSVYYDVIKVYQV